MKSNITAIVCCCWSLVVFSQHTVAPKQPTSLKFSSINQLGLLNGSGGVSYDLQTINGIAKGPWLLGLGVGIDNYISRSIPVFVDVQRELGSKHHVPFLYADGGLNYTWLNQVQKEQKGLPYATTPGLYMGGGIGVKLKGAHSSSLVMSVGYSFKQSKETVQPPTWLMPFPFPGQTEADMREHLDSKFRRIVVRIGIAF